MMISAGKSQARTTLLCTVNGLEDTDSILETLCVSSLTLSSLLSTLFIEQPLTVICFVMCSV